MELPFRLDSVKEKLGGIRNIVMNYSEMEAKVRDATNNDPWGASGTLMTEISQATHSIEDFNTIMEVIYKRFAEHGKNWRHVYKALTLLEYLVKNGHERVVHNARDHLYELKGALHKRQTAGPAFHIGLSHFEYIDEKGKDQGINVRNRSKEIVALLNDTERIKEERRTAAPAPADDFANFQAAAPTAASNGFDSFGAFAAPAPAPAAASSLTMDFFSTPSTAAPATNANLFAGMSAAPASRPAQIRPSAAVNVDPFGDIPPMDALPTPAFGSTGMLQPNGASSGSVAGPAAEAKVDAWGGKGLVDLDNLKRYNAQPKKEEHKPMQPNAKPTANMAQPMMAANPYAARPMMMNPGMAPMGGQMGGMGMAPMGGQMGGMGMAPMGGQMGGMGMAPMGGQMGGMGMTPMGGQMGGMGMTPMGGQMGGMGMGMNPGQYGGAAPMGGMGQYGQMGGMGGMGGMGAQRPPTSSSNPSWGF